MKTIPNLYCDYCHSAGSVFIAQMKTENIFSITQCNTDKRAYYKCDRCGLYFKHPKHDKKMLESFYSYEYHAVRYQEPLHNVLNKISTDKFTATLKTLIKQIIYIFKSPKHIRIETYLKKYLLPKKKPTILEVGGGTSPLLYLTNIGYLYTGIEPSKSIVTYFNKKGYKSIMQGFAEKMGSVPNQSMNAIICIGSLAFVYDIKKTLSEFWRVLKKQGIVLAVDINADCDDQFYLQSYANYGYSKKFLLYLKYAECPYELLEDYCYLSDKHEIVENGPKAFFILKKN